MFYVFVIFCKARFRGSFLIVCLMENANKMTSKINPGATRSTKRRQKKKSPQRPGPSWNRPFFGHRFFKHFGSLSAPFWSKFNSFGSIFAPFASIFLTKRPTLQWKRPMCNVQRSILDALGSILYEINRIWNRSPQVSLSQNMMVAKRRNKPTHHKETKP